MFSIYVLVGAFCKQNIYQAYTYSGWGHSNPAGHFVQFVDPLFPLVVCPSWHLNGVSVVVGQA